MRNPACSLGNTPSRHCPLSHAVREHTRGRHGAAASSKGDVTKMRGGAGGARASQRPDIAATSENVRFRR